MADTVEKKDEGVAQGGVSINVAAAPDAVPDAAPEPTQPTESVEDVPDPDEDDLDDLDDMLEEFSTVKLDSAKSPEPAPVTATAPTETPKATAAPTTEPQANAEDAFSEYDFAKQLQAGMADLLGELEKSPDMQAQFEDIFKQMNVATGGADAPAAGATSSAAGASAPKVPGEASTKAATAEAGTDASFQETIRRTMERMQSSGDQATAAAASGGGDDFMSEMLKQLSSGEFGGEGGDEDFSKMLMGMMEQLTNKEILYEPMKELHDKFPEWFEKNKDSTPADDLKRYEEQRSLVAEIVGKFEESTYSDDKASDREYIVDRMQKMQAAGSPPADLVGDMASAQEALSMPDDQCNPQ